MYVFVRVEVEGAIEHEPNLTICYHVTHTKSGDLRVTQHKGPKEM